MSDPNGFNLIHNTINVFVEGPYIFYLTKMHTLDSYVVQTLYFLAQ